jgi:glycine/D-amino acid oxidase-like deaminating enzyme
VTHLNTFAPSTAARATQEKLPFFQRGSTVIVVGAGAFGGWTALYLLRKGFKVTLIDAWGPGNSRSSSGDETRVIRSTYGANEFYFDLNVRALNLWKENQAIFPAKIFHNTGVLWFCYEKDTPLVDDSIPFAKKHGMEYEYLTPKDLESRFPLIHTRGLHHGYYDPFGGYLLARQATQCVQAAFVKEGGRYIQGQVLPVGNDLPVNNIKLSGGETLQADAYIFACGSWLGQLFPALLDDTITCTKQEVYYFGIPADISRAMEQLPVWVDVDGHDFYYGIPGQVHRGFKIGVDVRGMAFNPTTGERTLTPEALDKARKFITRRFPEMKHAPLLEHRVCPYENSPDGNFIFDLLPGMGNVFALGGGSGHGFKHGPALGELVAEILSGHQQRPGLLSLPTPKITK